MMMDEIRDEYWMALADEFYWEQVYTPEDGIADWHMMMTMGGELG
jgi:hypothetical protein